MITVILLFLLLISFIYTWTKESRIFLFLFHKLAFPARKGAALYVDKKSNFPESAMLEENWKIIQEELLEVMRSNDAIPKFHEVDKANHKISFDEGPAWKAVVLKAYDGWFYGNCKSFPQTFKLMEHISSISTAMFSILEPQAKIPAHTGKFSGIYRYHLGIAVPNEGRCFINVDGKDYYWKRGEGILFNDTYLHYVQNNSNEYRMVLFLDIKKPASYLVSLVNTLVLKLIQKSPVFKQALKTGKINTG
jgi:beta-hydroxylase